ncbi:MAG TPA: hypothetical protein DD637_04265 [Verrucomicrobia bacterium]|nr:hypothetical protein [Verrucomicrobiota bacterium]
MIIAENDKNNRTVIEFDTVRVNSRMGGETNRHWLKARPSGMKSDKAVFQEAVEACSLNVKPKAAAYLFDAVLSTAVAKVAEDGVPRRIGDLIKVYPVIKGTVEGPYSPYNPETCACLVAISMLGGLEKNVKTENIRFVNRRPGLVVAFEKLMSVGLSYDGTIAKAKQIRAVGTNIQYDAAIGDSAAVEWTEDGETKSIPLVPAEQDDTCLTFDWPAALDEVPADTELTFVFRTRAGIPDAAVQVNKMTVKLVTGE